MEFLPHISSCYHKALIESTKDSMHDEHRIAFPERRVFDGATVSFDDLAAQVLHTLPSGTDVASKTRRDPHCDGNDGHSQSTRGQPSIL